MGGLEHNDFRAANFGAAFTGSPESDTLASMTLGQFEPYATDLAPGDRGVLDSPWSSLAIERVTSTSHPFFETAYERLWQEFGERGEMERRDVIADRLAWDPRRPTGGCALAYEILVLREGDDVIAVRDHTVIVPPAALAGGADDIVVHLSHVLVEPRMRGRGVAAWLRALPVSSARRCFENARGSAATAAVPAITLVAEMEHDDGHTEAVRRRLRSYARAGFRMADPALLDYCQPDFRAAAEIDASVVRPVPLCLVLRRVGREHENSIPASALRRIVEALHAMFGQHVRSDHMDSLRELLRIPDGDEQVPLLVPGFAPPADRRVVR
jgi:GNAT superfamily N-acetyltransferase